MTYILSFIVAFGVTAIAGQILIPVLRRTEGGQSIREDGPTWHLSSGAPHHGRADVHSGHRDRHAHRRVGGPAKLGCTTIWWCFLFALVFRSHRLCG